MHAAAWILDVGHRARRLDCVVAPGQRPLAAITSAGAELGLALEGPVGARTREGRFESMFVLPHRGEGEGWEPLAGWAASDDAGFELYVAAMLGGYRPPTRALGAFYFGDTPALAAKLAHLVVKGHKRGTAGWVEAAMRDGSGVPEAGGVWIVTDGFGIPLAAIRTTRVERLAFADVGADHALAEGEGDGSLEDWREGHERFFRREAAALGLAFTARSEIFFERFELLAVFGAPDRVGAPGS